MVFYTGFMPEEKKTLIVRMPPELHGAVMGYCQDRHISASDLTREVLRAICIEGGEIEIPE